MKTRKDTNRLARRCRVWLSYLAGVIAIVVLLPRAGYALPSFARQTGMRCTTCHTAFPQLTPFGREFKLQGYVLSNEQSKLPPFAAMFEPSFTYTNQDQKPVAAKYFGSNNNVALTQESLFYAGRLLGPYAKDLFGSKAASVLNKIGTFLQGTYDGVARSWGWDNWEIRFADTASVHGSNVTYGAYVNNNPTVQDLWNTTPAWGFPFSASGLAPTPAAAPLIAGGVSQQVAGFGTYVKLFDLLYLELGGYRTLAQSVQRAFGISAEDVSSETQITNLAPYWRIAMEKSWGGHTLETGMYGLAAHTFPGRDSSEGKDYIVDIGLDSQYQYSSGANDVTLLLNWIHEVDNWDASFPLGNTSSSRDTLWNFSVTISYLFDKTYGLDFQYFQVSGSQDSLLYGDSRTGSPLSDGWVIQLNYLPFNKGGGPAFWPMSALKLSLQYWIYNRFDGSRSNYDGTGRNADDNNTLYLQAWIAF